MAASVPHAHAILEQRNFDIVVTDYGMPGLTGADLIAWLRDRRPTLPVVLCTAYPGLDLSGAQPDLVLEKPITSVQLAAAIKSLLEGRELRTAAPSTGS